jgi:hypothetical protein
MTWWSSALLAWAVVATVAALLLALALCLRIERQVETDDVDDLWVDLERPDEVRLQAPRTTWLPEGLLRLGRRVVTGARG